ncbi:MAG: OmpA family protein [Bacteroidales bacterium]|nr:OmpA family protein [Bacteroidales bacterium]
MRITKTLFLALLTLVLLVPVTSAQKKKLQKATDAFDAGEYFDAIDLYKDAYAALSNKELKTETVFKVAECYRLTNEPEKAELWFKKAIGRDYPDPIAVLHYAESMKKNDKYEEAIAEFKRYKELVPDDPSGNEGITSCELAMQWMENPVGYEVVDMKYFNSRGRDYSPTYARDDYKVVYITTSRDDADGNKIHGATGQDFSDIFVTKMDRKGKWSVPVALDAKINTEFEEGTPSLDENYNTMYFTRCEVSSRKKLGCEIMVTNRTADGWDRPISLDILPDSLVVAHPAISNDNLTLLFVSDMSGSIGGKDIWRVTRNDPAGEWGNPENLGSDINSRGNELFPYFHKDGSIYFASDGHLGMGGLDIFRATQGSGGRWNVENMRYPINSSSDDFGIVFENETERGYFSSTRQGKGNDNIFSFALPPLKFNITGVVVDRKTEAVIPEAKVKLIGSDGTTLENETGTNGSFKFMLKPNTDYIFLASKEGYLNSKGRETTKGQETSKDYRMSLELAAIDKPIELPNIFYDFGKWDLRPESMVALDRLVEVLEDNPNVTIELGSHTDNRDTESFNLQLSQRRAQSVIDYLISKGIATDRLTAKGYGESQPKVVGVKSVKLYSFLKEGNVLNDTFINSLASEEEQEIAHQMNRRTEMKVLRTDYVPANER